MRFAVENLMIFPPFGIGASMECSNDAFFAPRGAEREDAPLRRSVRIRLPEGVCVDA